MKENGGREVKANIESTQIEAHELFPIFFDRTDFYLTEMSIIDCLRII